MDTRARSVSRRAFIRRGAAAGLGTTALGVGGYTYGHDIEPGWVEVTRVQLILPRLDAAFNGYRLVQISDIHMDHAMTGDRLAAIVRLVNGQWPDLVAITGDFVTYDVEEYAAALVAALSLLRPRDTAVAVLGNHDYWADAAAVRGVIRDSGLIDLGNKVHTVRRGQAQLHLAGVDDYTEHKDRLDHVLAHLPSTGTAILLAHEPDYADISSRSGRFDLQLSGHSHGGQVCPPLLGPLVLPRYGKRYPRGLYNVGGMALYTNRGLGMLWPHVRINSRPEITVFTLVGAGQRS